MRTTTKSFLQFQDAGTSPSGKTRIVRVQSTGGVLLGNIQWYAPWRRYVFAPDIGSLFDCACLDEIIGEIEKMMAARKKVLTSE